MLTRTIGHLVVMGRKAVDFSRDWRCYARRYRHRGTPRNVKIALAPLPPKAPKAWRHLP
jgi:hypothetical protein